MKKKSVLYSAWTSLQQLLLWMPDPTKETIMREYEHNGGRHLYEGYCVSWKAEPISMCATTMPVTFVSERVMILAAAFASEKHLCSSSSNWNPKNVSQDRRIRWTMTALSVVRCFQINGSTCWAKMNLLTRRLERMCPVSDRAAAQIFYQHGICERSWVVLK